MQEIYQEIYSEVNNGRYLISCKEYRPEGTVKGVILGVHGFAGDKESSTLQELAAAAADRGYALVCFDFPAHGASPVDEEYLSVANCMNDLLYIAEDCRKRYPDAEKYLFATSFGAYIALLCSDQLKDFHFALRAPAVTMPEHILLDILQTTREEFEDLGVIRCGFERRIDLPFRFCEEMEGLSVMGRDFGMPMLIIHGSEDDVVPLVDVKRFCESNPQAELMVLPGADHRFKKPGEIDVVIDCVINNWLSE